MSIERSSSFSLAHENNLSLYELLLIKSASVIDEQLSDHRTQKLKGYYGTLRWASWSDSAGMNYQLQQQTERMNPEEVHTSYRFVSYQQTIDEPHADYMYDSYSPRVTFIDEHGKNKKCRALKVFRLVQGLADAPTGLSSQTNERFISVMRHNNIRDPRFSMVIRRALAKCAFGRYR
jgi:hypothetical protein